MLSLAAMQGAMKMDEAIDLLERALEHESAGGTAVSPKYVTDLGVGAMRVLVAADARAGYFAMKAYHTIEGVGTRYVVSLYRMADGELLALLDGQLITDMRTGAASGVAARRVPIPGPVTVGVIGSGNQARTQLESLAAVYAIKSAAVYSPTPENRERFAQEMGRQLGITITPVASAEAAARGRKVVITASSARSSQPVLHGAWLDGCRLLCAVGNTRKQFAEVDVDCFARAALVVVDSAHALHEAGELCAAVAAGALPESKWTALADVVAGKTRLPQDGMITFKSVGTALQDLALAVRYYEILGQGASASGGVDMGQLRASAGGLRR
ncbi:MAG: ornithine cyclodeaminase family protein [Burkholderiales bacterium]|nr:ornithine cyclodeaminase family protein [Burkholderiales bacterium]